MARLIVSCPLCGQRDFEPLYAGDSAAESGAAASQFSSSRQVVIRPPVVRCRRCEMVLANPQDEPADLQQVYQDLQDEDYHAEDRNRRHTARQRLGWIGQTGTPGRLLDVGCATGVFLEEAGQVGWQLWGLEPSAWAASQAQRRLPLAQVQVGFIEEAHYPAGAFDLITLWDVLEHLAAPAATLQHLRPWLAADGRLALNLPDVDSLPARVMGKRWVLLLREHLWYFSPRTITALLEQCGYRVVDVRANWVRFSLANVFTRLGQYGGPAGALSRELAKTPAFSRIPLQFPIGEMSVLAVSTA